MRPEQLLAAADDLLGWPEATTAGVWPRAAALLARQALEDGMDRFWDTSAPGLEVCSARAQLLCLGLLAKDEEIGEEASHAWWALSRACHHHAYELPPTVDELRGWCITVESILDRLATSRRPNHIGLDERP